MTTQLEAFGTVTISIDEKAATTTLLCAPGWNANGGPDFNAAMSEWEDAIGYDRDTEGVRYTTDDRPDGSTIITVDWSELELIAELEAMAVEVFGLVVEELGNDAPPPTGR